MEDETYNIRWGNRRLCDLDFADDVALFSEDKETLQEMTNALDQNAQRVGLHISSDKTKSMSISTGESATITLDGTQVEDVSHFTYLGSRIESDGDASSDVDVRIGKAAGVFRRLRSVWSRNLISIRTKIKLYVSIVLPTAIYACECWKNIHVRTRTNCTSMICTVESQHAITASDCRMACGRTDSCHSPRAISKESKFIWAVFLIPHDLRGPRHL